MTHETQGRGSGVPRWIPNSNVIEARAASKATEEFITDRRADIRVDSTLVLIIVSVTDPSSRFVTGLEKENFKLAEDKIDQEISQFSAGGRSSVGRHRVRQRQHGRQAAEVASGRWLVW